MNIHALRSRVIASLSVISLFLLFSFRNGYAQSLRLWYDRPAAVWTEALPVGNGTLGAMVYGGVAEEVIKLNEATLWSGRPLVSGVNPSSPQFLPLLRQALFAGNYEEANRLAHRMQGVYSESYMPLGDLLIRQTLPDQPATAFYRDLDLEKAVAVTKYTVAGVDFKREVFASYPDHAIIIRITTNTPGQLHLDVALTSQLHHTVIPTGATLAMKGNAPLHADPSYYNPKREHIVYEDSTGARGMRFETLLKAKCEGGKQTADSSGIHITGATIITLYLTAATSFNGYDKRPDTQGRDEHQLAQNALQRAYPKSYTTLLRAHQADYRQYFNRVSLTLAATDTATASLPTDARLEAYNKTGKDAALEALYFQYGRYLLIASSRTPNAPANLQGIWNKELRAPWSSNYTTNINVQMNYWPVESTNLSELHQPLIDLIGTLAVTGKTTASEFYNIHHGWVVNHNADIWGLSNPVGDRGNGDPKWANWPMGANWLSRHLWEHYLYTGNTAFLSKTAYPLMKGAAAFTLDWLIKDSAGHWVTTPSTSPENDFYDGAKKSGISIASTMDMGIIRDLFNNCIAAARLLHTDSAFIDTLKSRLALLYPFQTGSRGQLQEWYKDFADVDPHHRHTSHLYALHPAKEISPLTTPELAQAARKTLELRGDDGTGWSLAWKVNMWARLLDGNHAYTLFKNLLRLTKENNTSYNKGGGAYPNLFDAHPPFQIDGNFAGTAGVAEMLLQSQHNELHLLPALPDAWQSGTVKGLVGRGNFVVDMHWEKGRLQYGTVTARNGGVCKVRTSVPVQLKGTTLVSEASSIGYLLSFTAVKGKTYAITGL